MKKGFFWIRASHCYAAIGIEVRPIHLADLKRGSAQRGIIYDPISY